MTPVATVEGTLAHEAMHACFGAQPAESVVAPEMYGRALDARDLAGAALDQFAIESVGLAPAQVHPQEHLAPVLRLGATGARLDIEKCVGAVMLAREHAPELEVLDLPLQPVHVAAQGIERRRIVFHLDQFEQIAGVGQSAVEVLDGVHDEFQRGAFAAELLRALGFFPDARFAQFEFDFLQTVFLGGVVKDTP